jgi:hypothetical protein
MFDSGAAAAATKAETDRYVQFHKLQVQPLELCPLRSLCTCTCMCAQCEQCSVLAVYRFHVCSSNCINCDLSVTAVVCTYMRVRLCVYCVEQGCI